MVERNRSPVTKLNESASQALPACLNSLSASSYTGLSQSYNGSLKLGFSASQAIPACLMILAPISFVWCNCLPSWHSLYPPDRRYCLTIQAISIGSFPTVLIFGHMLKYISIVSHSCCCCRRCTTVTINCCWQIVRQNMRSYINNEGFPKHPTMQIWCSWILHDGNWSNDKALYGVLLLLNCSYAVDPSLQNSHDGCYE